MPHKITSNRKFVYCLEGKSTNDILQYVDFPMKLAKYSKWNYSINEKIINEYWNWFVVLHCTLYNTCIVCTYVWYVVRLFICSVDLFIYLTSSIIILLSSFADIDFWTENSIRKNERICIILQGSMTKLKTIVATLTTAITS